MADYFQMTDDQVKGCVSRGINKLVAQMQGERGDGLIWDKDVVQHIKTVTGVEFPMTTYRSYRGGDRVRIPALETLAVAFDVPLSYFLGPERSAQDYQRALRHFATNSTVQKTSFELPYYTKSKPVDFTITRSMASRLGLTKSKAFVIEVTRDNNGSPTLMLGSYAIIDATYSKVSMSGDYLMRNSEGTPVIAHVKTGVSDMVKVQMLDNIIDQPLSELNVLGRIVGSIG